MKSKTKLILIIILLMMFFTLWNNHYCVSNVQNTCVTTNILNKKSLQSINSCRYKECKYTKSNNIGNIKKNQENKVIFRNNLVSGSINLIGARIDNLLLLKYKESIKDSNKNIKLLSSTNSKNSYYAEFGWISNCKNINLPNNLSIWIANKKILNPNQQVTLLWKNNNNVKFFVKISLDKNYMFIVKQKIIGFNKDNIRPYAAISRGINDINKNQMLFHEGGIGILNNKLEEIKFDDLNNKRLDFNNLSNSWFGFSDKYWLTAIIPKKNIISTKFIGYRTNLENRYQADVIINEKKFSQIYFFAGAKKLKLLDYYERKYDIKFFDRAIDFGKLYFITKPIFISLNFFYSLSGNFGLAIIILTISIKVLLFPLAYNSFKGFNKIKKLQPKILMIRKSCGDNNVKFQKSIIELYKDGAINPMSGCLSILLQMPIFYALYKVLYIVLEMRHAKFCCWIFDLSQSDPTNIFTLFGLIPWNHANFLHVGVLPIIMALTLYFQQMLNSKPTDLMQTKMTKFLPLLFLFIFASFPAGLVLYWSCSNFFSIIQQLIINKILYKCS